MPVRTASDQPYRLQKFRLRLFYASDIRQPNLEVKLLRTLFSWCEFMNMIRRGNEKPSLLATTIYLTFFCFIGNEEAFSKWLPFVFTFLNFIASKYSNDLDFLGFWLSYSIELWKHCFEPFEACVAKLKTVLYPKRRWFWVVNCVYLDKISKSYSWLMCQCSHDWSLLDY